MLRTFLAPTSDEDSASASAVAPRHASGENVLEQIEILKLAVRIADALNIDLANGDVHESRRSLMTRAI